MKTNSAKNERIKRQYLQYLKDAKGQSEQTVDAVAKALARFETYNKMRDFKAFHYKQAVAFKDHLAEQNGQQSGEKLSKSTLYGTLAHLQRFFHWLAGQPGYKSKIQYSDADYFSLSDKDVRVATAKREQKAPTLEQVQHVIAMMPADTDIQKRDRALVAFTLLTGTRDGAMASMKLKHINLQDACVFQDAREVKTKFSKTFTTDFFPVGDEVRAIVEAWVQYLREVKLWGNDDPLFPATLLECGKESRQFEVAGLKRAGWSNASAIRSIFKKAFENAGLPYFNPHSLRDTLVQLGLQVCKSPEEFKVWSQNLGHDNVLTTFTSYGNVQPQRQAEIMRQLGKPQAPANTVTADEMLEAALRKLQAGSTGATE
jgi:integrase